LLSNREGLFSWREHAVRAPNFMMALRAAETKST
jgi:hypothetical protein